MSDETMRELRSIKELVMEAMAKLGELEIREDPDLKDPGPEPEGAQSNDVVPHLFYWQGQNCILMAAITQDLTAKLAAHDNIIRPSLALELMVDILDGLRVGKVGSIINHQDTWNEVMSLLEQAADEIRNQPADIENGWHIDEPEVSFTRWMDYMMNQVRHWEGQYQWAVANQFGSTFGRLTVGEAVTILARMINNIVVPRPKWGPLSMPDPLVPKWRTPQPWAGWLRSTMNTLAEDLSDEPVQMVGPPVDLPYSVPQDAGRTW